MTNLTLEYLCLNREVLEYKQSGWKLDETTKKHVTFTDKNSENRDIAANIAILKKGLCTVGHTGTYATGDSPSWSVGASVQ
ncbi:hypothetical protein [Waterburya agarophytonicola]|uniref:hypothetical protein n=1 Tax=Waterburya agarophytonicola TaxID=2886916 RepID=UPI001E3AFE64|nr:hypothetical protein [Waterburya agarophytonicola]